MSEAGHNSVSSVSAYIDRIMRLEDQLKDINAYKSEVYKEAVANGLNRKALRKTAQKVRNYTERYLKTKEEEGIEEIYFHEAMRERATKIATRAHEPPPKPAPPHDPDTGELTDPVAVLGGEPAATQAETELDAKRPV